MIQNSQDFPFAFFDWYLDKAIQKDLNKFYDTFERLHPERVKSINRDNHIIEVWKDLYYDDELPYSTKSFENFIKNKLENEVKISKQFIELELKNHLSNKDSLKGYALIIDAKIKSIKKQKTFSDYIFLESLFDNITALIEEFKEVEVKHIYKNFIPTFNLLPIDDLAEQGEKAKKLYDLLAAESFIDCSREDFIKAFTGQQIEKGINWLIIGRSRKVSKPSLLYFLDQLIRKKT